MISTGDRLDGKYRVTRRLGGGGFGEVFLADDEAIPQRQVAIKVLRRSDATDQQDLVWEMQALARFNHPNVVAFYHHFSDAERLYLVMEFCLSGSLDDRLRAAGPCAEWQVCEWGVTLCNTLAFVHDQKIVHHDIKPQNILFAGDGTIKLGDFGVANRRGGTRLYLPPEILRGLRVSRTDPRVDVYVLGITLIEALGGRHPFEDLADEAAIEARLAHAFVPSEMSRWLREVLEKATHPTPELRFQSARDFAEAISGGHVPHVFDGTRIRAEALAGRAEVALARRKWRDAEKLAAYALEMSADCVTALLVVGRCQLARRRTERAAECFAKAVAISPRTPVQRELGWIALEQGRFPEAISLLTDHLHRHATDYEAYNLLLKCFYLTGRYEAGAALARTLIQAKAPGDCFRSNLLLCQLLGGDRQRDESEGRKSSGRGNPFMAYNLGVIHEQPRAWGDGTGPSLKSKLLFEEYRPGGGDRAGQRNTVAVYSASDARHDSAKPILTCGSLEANDVVIRDRRVSRRHWAIVNFPDDVWLYDLGSTAGTLVDGQPFVGRMFLDGVHSVTTGGVSMRIAARSDLLV
jgi:tetratricopeptide (TPR) repeat protein/tRNA A-37 threonylcarbamoyl transferase component Bud32